MCVHVAWGEGHISAAFSDTNRPYPTLCKWRCWNSWQ